MDQTVKSCVQLFKHSGIEFHVRQEDNYRLVRANNDIPIGTLIYVEVMARRKTLDDFVCMLGEIMNSLQDCIQERKHTLNSTQNKFSRRLILICEIVWIIWVKCASIIPSLRLQRLKATFLRRNQGTCWETISVHSTTAVKATVLLFSTARDQLVTFSVSKQLRKVKN